MKYLKFVSEGEKETVAFARRLARGLKKRDCLALVGDFGSGKTTFVKGLAEGLGFRKKNYVCSPSFVILKIYPGRAPLYHFDLYRINSVKELEAIGFSEFVAGEGVAAIEWADKVGRFLPAGCLKITFSSGGPNRRFLSFSTTTKRLERLLEKVIKIP